MSNNVLCAGETQRQRGKGLFDVQRNTAQSQDTLNQELAGKPTDVETNRRHGSKHTYGWTLIFISSCTKIN